MAKSQTKTKNEDHRYTFEEYLKEFAPDYRTRHPNGQDMFGSRVAKDTLDILRGEKDVTVE